MRANNVFVDYLVFTDSVHLSLSCFLFSLFFLKMTIGVEHLSVSSELRRVTVDAGLWPPWVCISLISVSFIIFSFQSKY